MGPDGLLHQGCAGRYVQGGNWQVAIMGPATAVLLPRVSAGHSPSGPRPGQSPPTQPTPSWRAGPGTSLPRPGLDGP